MNSDNLVIAETGNPLEAAAESRKLWKAGSTLRVRFLEGDPAVHKRIEPIAHEWSQYANIKFQFVQSGGAEIRISFDPNSGSWSRLGTDSNFLAFLQRPSMNYGWLKPDTAEKEYRRVVLHEFGHALGLIHEHMSPSASIPWDEAKVFEYYKRTNKWDEAQTRAQVLTKGKADKFTRFDPQSIMLYAVPEELTVGNFAVGWNTELSASDKTFIAECYPFPKK